MRGIVPCGTVDPDRRMQTTSARAFDTPRPDAAQPDWEVVILDAGVGGIYQIKRLIDLGVRATVVDLSPDLGGTWYWNRYPGARFDPESYTYGYSFSKELLDEWHWTHRRGREPGIFRVRGRAHPPARAHGDQ